MYIDTVMQSARHKSAQNVRTYQRDSMTLFEIAFEEKNNETNCVGCFCSIYLEDGSHGSAHTASTPFQHPIIKLCELWYSIFLGYGETRVTDLNRQLVLTTALKKKNTVSDLSQL